MTTAFIDGELRDTATLPPTNAIAAFYGAEPLTPEESKNASLGLVWNSGDWLVTADWYHIKVEDRIALQHRLHGDRGDRDALVAARQPGGGVDQPRCGFFVNDFDTTTTRPGPRRQLRQRALRRRHHLLRWRPTGTRPRSTTSRPGIITEARVKKIEESLPSTKGYFSVNHQREVFHANLRAELLRLVLRGPLDSDVVRRTAACRSTATAR